MATLHFFLMLVAQIGLFIAIRKVDNDYLVRPYVREPRWSYATWGAAVYCEIKLLPIFAWGWVSRFRFDRFLGKRFAARDDGRPAIAHVVIRAVLGLLSGFVFLIVFAVLLNLVEYVLADVIGLPPYLPGQR